MVHKTPSLKSELFDKKNPAPLDNFIYPVFKSFLVLQAEALKLWQQDVVQQRLGMRDYIDLKDARMHWSKDKDGVRIPIVTLRPAMGIEVMDILQLYLRFFDLYAKMRNQLIDQMTTMCYYRIIAEKAVPGALIRLDKEDLETEYQLFALMKVMTTAMVELTLTHHHIDILEKPEDIQSINALVKSLRVGRVLSIKFQNGRGDYFEHPNSVQIGAFWQYARRKAEQMDLPEEPAVLGGGVAVTEETHVVEDMLISSSKTE